VDIVSVGDIVRLTNLPIAGSNRGRWVVGRLYRVQKIIEAEFHSGEAMMGTSNGYKLLPLRLKDHETEHDFSDGILRRGRFEKI
jgi:hypothetical protein